MDFDAIALQFVNDVRHLRIPDIRAILLEGKAQDIDLDALDRSAGLRHELDGLFGNEFAHAVVDATAGEDDLGVVADLVGLVGEYRCRSCRRGWPARS